MCEGCDDLCFKCESQLSLCEGCGCLCHCGQSCIECGHVGCRHGNNEESNEQNNKHAKEEQINC